MKTALVLILGLALSPSAFAIPYSFPVASEEVGEDLQATLNLAIESAETRCAENNDDFTYRCRLTGDRSFDIRTVFVGVESQPVYRSVYRTTVKGQFTCQCHMMW